MRWSRRRGCGRISSCRSAPPTPARPRWTSWRRRTCCTRGPPASSARRQAPTPFHLYRHQLEAIEKARGGESYIVTSGTGSGKSLTYFLPIVDTLVRQPATGERVAALVVYPMNTLVNSQIQALENLKEGYERHTRRAFPVTFAKFTGETSDVVRQALRQHPPPPESRWRTLPLTL